MKSLDLLCVFTRILGGKTFSAGLLENLSQLPDLRIKTLFFEDSDYRRFPVPAHARMSSALESSWIIRKKFEAEQEAIGGFDALFFQSYHLISPFDDWIKRKPTAVALDITPVLASQLHLLSASSWSRRLRSRLSGTLGKWYFRPKFRNVDMFLPRSSWCANSLIEDFGIGADSIRTLYYQLDLDLWRPSAVPPANDLPVLLFVGAFSRKGGPFLLDLYSKHLAGKCRVKIVSGDPALNESELPDGVEVLRGLSHDAVSDLIRVYQACDVFMYPSFFDAFGAALGEALAAGLPIVARAVGGVPDFVRDGENGRLLNYRSTIDDWAEAIIPLLSDVGKRRQFGEASRALALEKMSGPAIRRQLEYTVERLRSRAEFKAKGH